MTIFGSDIFSRGLISVFSNKHENFYNKSMWKNVHPVSGSWDLNPRPLEHKSSLITTRPGLPPNIFNLCS